MNIREIRSTDAEAMVELIAELGYDSSAATLRERIECYLSDENTWAYVIENERRLAAAASYQFVPYFHRDGGLLRITAIVVHHSSRRLGLGSQLIWKAHELAVEAGCDRIELTSADHRADVAFRFYEHMGFERYAGARYLKHVQRGAALDVRMDSPLPRG